jgi:hypothetical protein
MAVEQRHQATGERQSAVAPLSLIAVQSMRLIKCFVPGLGLGLGVCSPKAKVTRSNRVGCAIISITYPKRSEVSESKTHHKLTKNKRAPAQNLRGCGSFSYEQSAVSFGASTRNLAVKTHSLSPAAKFRLVRFLEHSSSIAG